MNETNEQLSLSFELICFMDWMLKHGKKQLRDLVKNAIQNGLAQELDNIDEEKYLKISEYLHHAVLDFVLTLEDFIIEELEGVSPKESVREKTSTAIKNLDTKFIDVQTILLSLQQAKSKLLKKKKIKINNSIQTKDEAKDVLCTQILKNWKPNSNEPVN
jgi:hypothetical protein